MHITVERELEMTLVLSPEHSASVPAKLLYRTDDPYAVHVSFHIGSAHPVHWTFARDLLMEGVFRPSGHGDVRVWPLSPGPAGRTPGRSVMCMALSSPEGEALLQAPSGPVAAWVERTLRLVPPGQESAELDLDEELGALLSEEPGV
ncbi:SsgA family sporulation/cell division regulator [Streptomyces sp. WMMC1477]|uniref:SsgA family sporulation/cell division regulator n=1 Tax=Streptomyces sp. WMMC1477 TaxID=3015155 RepID=UPI0022B6417C|nr:SsgA family sporulation/cell division regulator [Streptomyces sp. WMMC1477]MCZ7431445.1 SsgA family sporulation/cell division regulator [Streptomyces sp. WMMC1477]